jgi:hypothetical protein
MRALKENTLTQKSKRSNNVDNNNNNNNKLLLLLLLLLIDTDLLCYLELRNVKYNYIENNNNSIRFLFMYVQT